MAHIPEDDVKKLWNEMGDEKSWSALHDTLKSHRNQAKGIDDNMVDQLIRGTDHLKDSGQSFPKSPDRLAEVLNERVKGKKIE